MLWVRQLYHVVGDQLYHVVGDQLYHVVGEAALPCCG